MKIGRFLRENGMELWIEPGRALLEQVGITVATVMKVRPSSQGETLVCLNMKRQDVCFLDQEIFVDPIIIYGDQEEQSLTNQQPSDGPLPVYFAGNLCLESDLITRHQVWIPRLPKPGDMVAFINTAGYFMDFSASEAIMHPIANKVAVFRDKSGFGWALDENYDPLRRLL
jgi:diaminopimelate decarboxylase